MNSVTTTHKSIRQMISELYISIVITFLSISFWSVFVLFFRPLYKWSISLFHIEKISGFTKTKLLDNYNALIDYYFPWVKGNLSLPSLQQSPHAIQHFAEVKDIFNMFMCCIPIAVLLLALYIWLKRGRNDFHYLKTASITLIIAPFILASGFIIDFDKTFTIVHQIFFDNDYWLFDSKTDPIITMLLENFFLLCAVMIIIFQFLMSLVCFLVYKRCSKSQRD